MALRVLAWPIDPSKESRGMRLEIKNERAAVANEPTSSILLSKKPCASSAFREVVEVDGVVDDADAEDKECG